MNLGFESPPGMGRVLCILQISYKESLLIDTEKSY